jgi:hypothetical protein
MESIRIRYKHPGSATLPPSVVTGTEVVMNNLASCSVNQVIRYRYCPYEV